MVSLAESYTVSSPDRTGVTVCIAIVVHAIIILGVGFEPFERFRPQFESMEIILVQQESERKKDEKFAYLAQASLEGGGDSEEKVTPSTPLTAPMPELDPDIAMPLSTPVAVASNSDTQLNADTSSEPPTVEQQQQDADRAAIKQPDYLAAERLTAVLPMPEEETQASEASTSPSRPSALISNSVEQASLNAQVRQRIEDRANRPRRKFISSSTKEYKFAKYMDTWRVKVERIGNLNYPDAAKRRRLSGNVMLDVAINTKGSILEITVRKSSGHKILDDAAIRTVKLGAPYAPFPDSFSDELDILHITRTWRYQHRRFSSRR